MIDDPLNRLKVLRGEQLPQSKLTDEDVRWIHQCVSMRNGLTARAKTFSNSKMAERLGVSQGTIDRITAGHGWTHIEEDSK